MRLFGLIGYPLEHSFSPQYFANKFEQEGITDCAYRAFPIKALDEITTLLTRYPNLEGLNVTKPYKQMVLNYLNTVDGEAYSIGAVNTIRIRFRETEGGFYLKGFNTDIYGFYHSLNPLLTSDHKQALILGSGGASKAVQYVLASMGIGYRLVSRKPGEQRINYEELTPDIIANSKLIINSTPIGTHPRADEAPPLAYEAIGSEHLLYDLVYNPSETLFMQKGRAKGAIVKNGREMLELQAERSWMLWNEESG